MERINPYSPIGYTGLGQTPADYVYVTRYHQLTFTLSAGEFVRDRASEFTDEGDFILRAVILSRYTGAFQFQFTDANGYTLSNTMIDYTTLLGPGNARVPMVISPELVFPKSSKISVSLRDLSGASNTIVFVLCGALRGRG